MSETKLERGEAMTADVEEDEMTLAAIKAFDLAPEDHHFDFVPYVMPELPEDYAIGLIIGASGSGKSLLLKSIGGEKEVVWQPRRSIVSHFASAEEAAERFYAVGLNTVPTWRLPYDVLSNGQRFRADLARRLETGGIVDEFTSVVDRNVAIAASRALNNWIERSGTRRMVFASCHRDIIPWLRPDWMIDTDSGEFIVGHVQERPSWYVELLRKEEPVGALILK